MITGRFTLYELVLILLWVATTIRMYIGHRMHTKQISKLQQMHAGTVSDHPPEPSPGETLPAHVGQSSSQLLRGERGAVNVLYVLLCALVLIVILVLLGFHPTL